MLMHGDLYLRKYLNTVVFFNLTLIFSFILKCTVIKMKKTSSLECIKSDFHNKWAPVTNTSIENLFKGTGRKTIFYRTTNVAALVGSHWAPALGGTHSWIFLRVVGYGTYCCGVPLTLNWWISARNFLGSGGWVVGGSSVMQCSQRCLKEPG